MTFTGVIGAPRGWDLDDYFPSEYPPAVKRSIEVRNPSPHENAGALIKAAFDEVPEEIEAKLTVVIKDMVAVAGKYVTPSTGLVRLADTADVILALYRVGDEAVVQVSLHYERGDLPRIIEPRTPLGRIAANAERCGALSGIIWGAVAL